MGLLSNFVRSIKGDPAKLGWLPPYLSLLCLLGGVVWTLLLPLQQYSRRTYISENALLPGQVHTYFAGSDQNIFRAYRHEVARVIVPPWTHDENGTRIDLPVQATDEERGDKFVQLFRNAGLKVGRQAYHYWSSGNEYEGENIYGVLHAPRGDGTEAIVLLAPVRNIKDEVNLHGVTLLFSLAKYMKRWSLWSKDIIFVVTPDIATGPQAWVDAYHSQHDARFVEGLPLKSGALQGAVCLDYSMHGRFGHLFISYDGINGQLPNLDLINTAVSISSGQIGIDTRIQDQPSSSSHDRPHAWSQRVLTMARGMANQALGHATGAHSVFMPYHIDAITLTAVGNGWHDEMAFGRTVESICRSLNNLLEKLHQSFFFYLLMETNRFVSIGSYLPSAMAIAAGYTVIAIYLWIISGYRIPSKQQETSPPEADVDVKIQSSVSKCEDKQSTGSPAGQYVAIDRSLTLPIALLTSLHLVSVFPIFVLTRLHHSVIAESVGFAAVWSLVFPIGLASFLTDLGQVNPRIAMLTKASADQFVVIKSLSLLLLGLFLTVLATLNFSLSMFLGLACAPLAFVSRTPGKPVLAALQYLALALFSPAAVSLGLLAYAQISLGSARLSEWFTLLAFGWNVWGSWGVLVGVFCIWWPAWTAQALLVASSWFGQEQKSWLNNADNKAELDRLVAQKRKAKEEELRRLNGPKAHEETL
ncbi:hypothetical protein DV735_g5790, partial [Chaetothyriales sp. CBS 134920]